VTWFGVERSKVKVTQSITLHSDGSFQTTTTLHPHSIDGDTGKNNMAWVQTLYSSFAVVYTVILTDLVKHRLTVANFRDVIVH